MALHPLRFRYAHLTVAIIAALFASGCRRDPCALDPFEDNESFATATDLGSMTDQESHFEAELTLDSPTDIDVFTFSVRDEGNDGNPEVDIFVDSPSGELISVKVEYRCTSDVMTEFNCAGGELVENDLFSVDQGRTCAVTSFDKIHLNLNYDCQGTVLDDTDSGFAVLTITRQSAPTACAAYDLDIFTD